MIQSCERSVYIQVCIHRCSYYPGTFGRKWGRQSQTLYLPIKNVIFIITIVTTEPVLQSLHPLITFLQSKLCNLCHSYSPNCVTCVIPTVQTV